MTQGALSVKVGGDFSELFNGFKQLPAEAAKAGQGIEKGLNDGVDGAANRLKEVNSRLGKLITEIGRLKEQRAKLEVDSSEYVEASKQLEALRAERSALSRERTLLKVDSSEAKEASNQFRLLDGVIGGIAFSLTNTLTNAAGTALQAISSIPRTVSQFDTARAAVATLGVDTAALSGNFVGLSKELNNNVSQVELLQAAYDVASSGFADAASNTEVMRAAALLATGGFTDLQTAGDGLTSVLNAYGLSAADATKVTDMIIQTQNDGKIVAGEYAQQIGRLAPTAVASGVALEELNAAISSATAQGVPVGSTFSGIQQAIVSILKPSQDASKYAAELGIEWNAAALQAKGFGGFLQQLVDKGAASSESIIRLTGSTEAQSALMPLLNDGLEKYNENLERQKNSAGVAADASEKATATIDGSLKRLGNTFSNLTVEVFSGLAPIVAGAINAVTGFVQVLANLPGPVIALGGALLGLVGTVTAAAVAYSLFTSSLVQGQIAAAGAAITSLAASISGTLGAVVPVATLAVGKLTAALVAMSTTQFSLSAIGAAIQTNIVAAANAGALAFGKLTTAVSSGALLSGIKALASSAASLLATVAPLALAIAGVIALVKTWQYVLGGAQKVTDEFAGSQKAVSEALVVMAADLDNAAEKAKQAQFDFLGLGNIFREAREGWTLMALVDETKKLEQGFDQVYTSAIQFFKELKDSEAVTEAQRKQAEEYIKQLEKVSAAYRKQAEAAKAAAVEAARVGNADEAKFREAQARSLENNAKALETLVVGYQKELGVLPATTAATQAKTAATQVDTEAQKLAAEAVKARAAAEAELNTIISEAPVRNLEAQLAVGQQLVGLAKAVAEQEQSRFGAIKAGIEFELSKAEERGASEKEIGDLKRAIDKLDRDAAEARFRALTQQQELEIKMLELAQQKAVIEADLSVQQARVDLLKAESELRKATTTEERAAAQAQINLQQEILGIREQGKALLGTIQPLEQAILATQQDAARNAERNRVAQEGYKIAADGSLESLKRVTQEVVVSSERQADGTIVLRQRYQEVAQAAKSVTGAADATTLAISRAADGSIILTQRQAEVAGASANADRAISSMANKLGISATNAGITAEEAAAIGGSLGDASKPASGIADAFVSTSGTAPKAAQGALDFAAYLDKARNQGQQIADLPLAAQMANVARSTQAAAGAAQQFYSWLERASRLPGSRWTGGPVEAGESYRINELGQEALLSHGRLSLINAPANSTWRAPADGTVIPAGITARLQDQGVLPGGGGAMAITTGTMSNAALAIEVGKLRQEVGELARKSWNVGVTMKTGPTGSQVMRQMMR